MEKENNNLNTVIFSKAFFIWVGGILFSFIILVMMIKIKFFDKDKYLEISKSYYAIKEDIIPASRGNIYAEDGTLIATSSPRYDIYLDFVAIDSALWKDSSKFLCDSLSAFAKDLGIKNKRCTQLKSEKKKNNRYFKLFTNISFYDMMRLSHFPIFNKGRYKGGFIVVTKNSRELIFGELAKRTIGYQINKYYVGLEGAYENVLKGIDGKRLIKRVAPGQWLPLSENEEIKPVDGKDILTTIDIYLQEITHNALYNHLKKHKAHHGTAIVMEVSTGEIKAIANLTRTKDSSYVEDFNYAIGEGYEPGSTFKLFSLMAALDDGKISPDDQLPIGKGELVFRDKRGNVISVLKDAHEGGYGTITVRQAFELSSNVGVAMATMKAFGKNPAYFVNKLKQYGVLNPLNLEIPGEAKPFMIEPGQQGWSNLISLPWLSIGYGVKLSPIHLLTYYNAIANGGKVVKPRFVKAILQKNDTIQKFAPIVLRESFCKPQTVKILQSFMEGVVERGTAQILKTAPFKIAGKTSTAQISRGGKYKESGSTQYYAGFVGYFPADNPKYSCIVVINRPAAGEYYGGSVAAPVFLEIADKIYSYKNELFQKDTTSSITPYLNTITTYNKINQFISLLKWKLSIPVPEDFGDIVKLNNTQIESFLPKKAIKSTVFPSLLGLKAQDAIDILEFLGCRPILEGRGEVSAQLPPAGTPIRKGMKVILKLK